MHTSSQVEERPSGQIVLKGGPGKGEGRLARGRWRRTKEVTSAAPSAGAPAEPVASSVALAPSEPVSLSAYRRGRGSASFQSPST